MQGIFAKDWTEQFGAFGNVLNAFFANVENVWNAVKSIFSGIVSFVKNVFAGDCLFSEVLLMVTGFQKADSLNGRRLLAKNKKGGNCFEKLKQERSCILRAWAL